MRFRKLADGNYQLDDTDRKPIADYPVYVNVKNERRFFRATPIRDAQTAGDRDKAILSTVSLRQQKALHLYHLIREYKLLTWWDRNRLFYLPNWFKKASDSKEVPVHLRDFLLNNV